MQRLNSINSNADEIIDISEGKPEKVPAATKYIDANFDISQYIKVMQGKLKIVERLSDYMDTLEEMMKSPHVLASMTPKDIMVLYQSIIRRANMEATLVSKFVDDSVKNSLIKKRMMVEQKKLERDEAEARRQGTGDSTTGKIAKTLKSILLAQGKASTTGNDNVEEVDFNGEV